MNWNKEWMKWNKIRYIKKEKRKFMNEMNIKW